MNGIFLTVVVAIAVFGYVAWAVTSVNCKTEKKKEQARENRNAIEKAQHNAELLKSYCEASTVIRDNFDTLKKEVANAQNDEEIHAIINRVISSNNNRLQNNNNTTK